MSYWGVVGKQNHFTWLRTCKYAELRGDCWETVRFTIGDQQKDIRTRTFVEVSDWRKMVADIVREMREK